MLPATETTIFTGMIARVFVQCKQPYLLFINKMIDTCFEDTTQTTTFSILAETFYIPSTFCNFNNQFIG